MPGELMWSDVFISFAAEDAASIPQVRAILDGAQIASLIPDRQAPAGATLDQLSQLSVDACRLVLVIHSAAGSKSPAVLKEVRRAREKNLKCVLCRIDETPIAGELQSLLKDAPAVDAFPSPLTNHAKPLIKAIRPLLDAPTQRLAAPSPEAAELAKIINATSDESSTGESSSFGGVTRPTIDSPPPPVRFNTPAAVSSFSDGIESLRQTQSVAPPARLGLIGQIDHFELIRKLGEGGMGVVMLARNSQTDQLVAIKSIRAEYANNPRAQHRFIVEAKHMQRMQHPNILKVWETRERSNGAYYVMPFVSAGSLATRIQPEQSMPEASVLKIGKQIAAALQYAHDDAGVIHRDIKPENVLIDAAETAYLSDFGLVRTVFNDSVPDNQQGSWTVGTRPYMAPEIVAGKAGDTRADIYSFGAMLYEMASGMLPFSGDNSEEIMSKIKFGSAPKLQTVSPGVSPDLALVIEGAMGKELRDRYAHMADVLADLERVERGKKPLGPHGTPARPAVAAAAVAPAAQVGMPPVLQQQPKPRRSTENALMWVAIAVVGVIALGAATQYRSIFTDQTPTAHAEVQQRSEDKFTPQDANKPLPPVVPPMTPPPVAAIVVATPVPSTATPTPPQTAATPAANASSGSPITSIFAKASQAMSAITPAPAAKVVTPEPIKPTPAPIVEEKKPQTPDPQQVQDAIASGDSRAFDSMAEHIDPNAILPGGQSAVAMALTSGQEKMALKLVRSGAKLDVAQTSSGDTVLDLAAAYGMADVINELHSRNVNLDAPHRDSQQTPLYSAVFNRQAKAAHALVECGADPDLKVGRNDSPRQLAERDGSSHRDELVQALQK